MREAIVVVGAACALIGLFLRQRNGDTKGLSMALVVVGLMLIVAGPLGRYWDFW